MQKKKSGNLIINLEKEEEGGYHAFCPLLPGCHTQGDTYEEIRHNIEDAIELYIERRNSGGQTLLLTYF